MTTLEMLNQAVFLPLNADASTAPWQLALAAVMAEYLIDVIPLLLVGLCGAGASQCALALKACVVVLIALGVNQLLGLGWPHPRPLAMRLGHTFIAHAPDSSFPSDHATVFAAIGLTLVLANLRSLAGWATLLGGSVAWARIFLGVHFQLDMLGAVAVAGTVWLGIDPVERRVGERLAAQAAVIYRTLLARPIAQGWMLD
jgi:undecaprenyl-diphosphatase